MRVMPIIVFTGKDDAPGVMQFATPIPKFSGKCVCCSADARENTAPYDIYAERGRQRINGPPVPMPVCAECVPHALERTADDTRMISLLLLGIAVLVIGVFIAVNNDGDAFGWAVAVMGGLMSGAGGTYLAKQSAQQKRDKKPGHFPGLKFVVFPGQSALNSDNEALIAELLALNPNGKLHVAKK